MGVAEKFQTLAARIQPTSREQEAADRHVSTLKASLKNIFDRPNFRAIGSHSRGSAITKFSDVDQLVIIARDDAHWGRYLMDSSNLLGRIRRELQSEYPHTDIGKDGQAVKVTFSDNMSVDLVPAYFHSFGEYQRPIYMMPTGNGDWMGTSPESHNKFIEDANVRSGHKLRRAAQLVKFWRECRSPRTPLSSFHLEMLLAAEGTCEGPKSHAEVLTEVFQLLVNRNCGALRDPLGISGLLPATATEAQREQALQTLLYARDKAKDALYAERNEPVAEAYRKWDIVFNGNFPA